MKKLSFTVIVLLFFISCNFRENFDKKTQYLKKVQVDLETHFHHKPIGILTGWGTEDDDNYLMITLYDYNMDSKNNSELESLANSIIFRVTAKNPKFEH